MPRISPRFYVFCVSALFSCFGIAVAVLTFSGLNVTTIHITGPLLICYAAAYLICAPVGLWGILGATRNNAAFCSRYVRDHWLATIFLSIIEALKLVFIFTLKDKTIESLIDPNAPYDTEYAYETDRVESAQKVAIIQVSIQVTMMITLGIVALYSCKKLSPSHISTNLLDLEASRPRPTDQSSITTTELTNKRSNLDIDDIVNHPPSPFIHRPKLEKIEESALESNKIDPHPSALKPVPNNPNIPTNIPRIRRSSSAPKSAYNNPNLSTNIPEGRKSFSGPLVSERSDELGGGQQNQSPTPNPAPPIIASIQQQQQSTPTLRRKRTQTFGSTRDAAPLDPPSKRSSNTQQSRRRSKSTSAITGLTVPTVIMTPPTPRTPPTPFLPSSLNDQQQPRLSREEARNSITNNEKFVPGHRRTKTHPQNKPLPIPPSAVTISSNIPTLISQIPDQKSSMSQIPSSNLQRSSSSSKRNSKRFSPRLSPIPEGLRRTSLPIQTHIDYSDLRHSSSLPNLLTQNPPYYNLSDAPPVPPLPFYLQSGSSAPKSYQDNNISSKQSRNYQRNQNEPQKLQMSDRYVSHSGNSGDSPRSAQFPFNQGPYQGRDNNAYSNTTGHMSSPKVRPKSMHSTVEDTRRNSKYYNNQSQNNNYYPNQRDQNYRSGEGNVMNRNNSSRRKSSDLRGSRPPRVDQRDSRGRREMPNVNNMIPSSRQQGGYINQQPRDLMRENLMTMRYK
ncbi:4368_t:CDS:2 [Ambispora leptoticha]|uniref:4368_t:CDS:1 n=1 Tax=Ambispora leptoticha TaxID=144679 RepID=A0A9N8WSV2_9GLOM|nr:4368_t:CDS:2 [Ambispora leptoticha]